MNKRRNALIILELVLFVLCSFLMYQLQTYLFYRNADREIELTFQDTDRILAKAEVNTDNNYDSYELIHLAKTRMAKYYINNDEDTGYTDTSMKNLKQLLNVSNVYIVDKDWKIVFFAETPYTNSLFDMEESFYDEMERIRGTNNVTGIMYFPVPVSDDSGEDNESDDVIYHSFCAACFSDGYYVVIEDDASGLLELQDESTSWRGILPHITLGRNGFVFSAGRDGWINAFSDDEDSEVEDISELGIKVSDLKDGLRDTLVLQGKSYYCGVKYYEDQQEYLICAIPSEEITSDAFVVTAVPLFIVFILLSLQLLYALMLMGERNEADEMKKTASFRLFLFRRMAVLLLISILFTIGISLYVQELYAMYLQAQSNKQEADALVQSLGRNEEIQKKTSDEYYSDLESLTTLAAKFISDNKKQITRRDLENIAKNLGAEHVLLYDREGVVILSDAYYQGLMLSSNPRELSYEFRKVLTGTPVLAQQKIDDDYLDEPYRYVGAIVTDANDELNGIVQLLFAPDYLSSSLSDTSVETLPSTFSGRNNAFAFIVDGDAHTLIYYPEENMIGDSVMDYGLADNMIQDDFFVRTWFDGEERLLYGKAWKDDLIFTAASVSLITMESISRGVFISIAGIAIQLLFFFALLLLIGGKETCDQEVSEDKWEDEKHRRLVEKQAADRILRLLTVSFFVFSGGVYIIFLMRYLLFKNNDVLLSLLNGYWNPGIHIFSITACWISICVIYFGVSLVLLVLELTGKLMNSRGETIVRMLISFARYIAVIGAAFYCAKLLGAPTDTLLASAGIITVVLGFGAQSLVTDVLAGLFIIFERSYKVGDIIRMDGEEWRGRVLEIGIRNTRVMDIDENNIKIIHNSSMNQIINLTDLPTFVYTMIGTEYGDKLCDIEAVIEKELPEIHKHIPGAIEGPTYSGVAELGDSAVVLKFRTTCRNEDYLPVKYAVNRELKLMFDRYSINVPFSQVVINYREEEQQNKDRNK